MHPGAIVKAVYLHVQPVDFRKQMNGLSLIVEQELGLCPFDPVLYAFINRRKSSIKILYLHRNGLCMWQKRLEKDRFAWPDEQTKSSIYELEQQQLLWLLEGFDLWHFGPHKSLNYRAIS